MRALITGMEGFVGRHLAHHLLDTGYDVVGTQLKDGSLGDDPRLSPLARACDIRRVHAIESVVREANPGVVFHLAAISHVPYSWENPSETFEANTLGTLHVLEAARLQETPPRMVYISSGTVYGRGVATIGRPLVEDDPVAPSDPYAASKAHAEAVCRDYAAFYGLDIVIARPFNHTGPGQRESFVCSAFAKQVAAIESGRQQTPEVLTGDLSSIRDFTDVRDVVRAYELLGHSGIDVGVYNVCSGHSISTRWILEHLISLAAFEEIRIREDTGQRPGGRKQLTGDNRKLREATGWSPRLDMLTTLSDLLQYWRERTAEESLQSESRTAPRKDVERILWNGEGHQT